MSDTTLFKRVTTPSGRVAFEAVTAVWEEGECAISAPTMKQLEAAWQRATGAAFNPSATNHVYVTLISKFEDRSDKSL